MALPIDSPHVFIGSELTNKKEILQHLLTPAFIYNFDQFSKNISVFSDISEKFGIRVFFAVKSNNSKKLIEIIKESGIGFDVNSAGELKKVIDSGIESDKIIFAGVGKTDSELRFAIQSKIRLIKVESLDEVKVISELSDELNQSVNIGLRLNPNIDAKTHPYISTGLLTSKFGIDSRDIPEILDVIKSNPKMNLKGLDAHIGSQIQDLSLYLEIFDFLSGKAEEINKLNFQISEIDLGGGFGIDYDGSGNSTLNEIHALFEKLSKINNKRFEIFIEPGRALVANTCMIVSKVLYTKRNGEKQFAIIDASMTENIRPALYKSKHSIVKLNPEESDKTEIVDIVGPVCETSDYLGLDVSIQQLKRGDFVGILDSGAYTSVMASNYNLRPFRAEYLWIDSKMELIRKPQDLEEIINAGAVT